MKRLGAVAFLAGAVLLSTHILAPAAPPPAPPDVRETDVAAAARDRPLIARVDSEVSRLRDRLNDPPPSPRPTRNPFRFGSPPAGRQPVAAKAAERPATASVTAPMLPRLIAIATGTPSDPGARVAILALGETVEPVKTGDRFLNFRLERIGADAVDLSDPATGRTFQISLQ
jgi:hypothetical protein